MSRGMNRIPSTYSLHFSLTHRSSFFRVNPSNMIRWVTGVKSTLKATTVMAPQSFALKSSKACSADVEGNGRHPTISFTYLLITFLLENTLPVCNLCLTHGKDGHAVQPMTALQRSASKSSKACSADVEGDGRHPTISFMYVTYWWHSF